MGFYGSITNQTRTSFTFDKIYSNRYDMDQHVENDGIYAGRYVLVEYDSKVGNSNLTPAIKFGGVLFKLPDLENIPQGTTSIELQPLRVGEDGNVTPGQIVFVPTNLNFGNDPEHTQAVGEAQYCRIASGNNESTITKLNYNISGSYQGGAQSAGVFWAAYTVVNDATVLTTNETNYGINYSIDAAIYGNGRGYDSTVWQKTYASGEAKYVMIAELNSVVPILDITADAPTLTPIMPHFDKDSTNVYYKLHMQPTWGFRVKAADRIQIPALDYSGKVITGANGRTINASNDDIYPSDMEVTWANTIYENDEYKNQYLAPNGTWSDSIQTLNGAIYFNRAGFLKDNSVHSYDNVLFQDLKDEIKIEPTGFSGHLYNEHATNGQNLLHPDVNEISVILPSIGNAIADMWDIVYGDNVINGTADSSEHPRNTTIRWEDAKRVGAKEGLRLVNDFDKNPSQGEEGVPKKLGYSYATDQVNTLAGVINSAQDIMGMIICSDYTAAELQQHIDELNPDYIYYAKDSGTYWYKKPYYKYEELIDEDTQRVYNASIDAYNNMTAEEQESIDNEYKNMKDEDGNFYSSYENYLYKTYLKPNGPKPISLTDWESIDWHDYWYKDTTLTTYPDYIQDKKFHDGVKYYTNLTMPPDNTGYLFNISSDPNVSIFTKRYKNDADQNFTDEQTQALYHKYVPEDKNGTMDLNTDYYRISNEEPYEIKDDEDIYIPNKFYEATYVEYKNRPRSFEEYKNLLGVQKVRLFVIGTEMSHINNIYKNLTELKANDRNDYNIAANAATKLFTLQLDTCKEKNLDDIKHDLFKVPLDSVNDIGNTYYIISEKYEFIDLNGTEAQQRETIVCMGGTWHDNLAGSTIPPGIYYKYNYGEKAYNDAKNEIIENNFLKDTLKGDIELDNSIDIDANCLYFRKVVSLQHTNTENVIDISNAVRITNIIDLPNNLYRKCPIGQSGKYEYKQITNQSSEIIYTTNYSQLKDLVLLDMERVSAGYEPYKYYYKVPEKDVDYVNSLILDTRNNPDSEVHYFKRNDIITNINKIFQPAIEEFYVANKYYYWDENINHYVLDTLTGMTPGRQYYTDPQYYVMETGYSHIYSVGAPWPIDEEVPLETGIKLGKRKEIYKLIELEGFDDRMNTMHGLILRLNQLLLEGDTRTRDKTTVQGCINSLNDIIDRFYDLNSGNLVIVDNCGRVHSAEFTTSQEFSAVNMNDPGRDVKILNSKGDNQNTNLDTDEDDIAEDKWIDFDIDPDYNNPKVYLYHNFTKVEDTTTHVDKNLPWEYERDNYDDPEFTKGYNDDTLKLYTPIVDAKGHIVGKNEETVVLPFSFKKYLVANSTSESKWAQDAGRSSSSDEHTFPIVADNTKDIMRIQGGNKWIRFQTDATRPNITADTWSMTDPDGENKLTIAHETHDIDEDPANSSDMNNPDTDYLTIQDTYFDTAGHLTGNKKHRYVLPYGFKYIELENSNDGSRWTKIENLNKLAANNTKDTLIISAGNRWVRLDSNDSNGEDRNEDTPTSSRVKNKLTIAHATPPILTSALVHDFNISDDSFTKTDFTYDEAGHIHSIKLHSYVLPYGFKYVEVENETEHNFTGGEDYSTEQKRIVADNIKDTLKIKAGNSWIKLKSDAENGNDTSALAPNPDGNNILTIAHRATGVPTAKETRTHSLNNGILSLHAYDYDEAGHITAKYFDSYYLPYNFKYVKLENSSSSDIWKNNGADSENDKTIIADSAVGILRFAAGNKWIRLESDAVYDSENAEGYNASADGNNKLTLAHETHNIPVTASTQSCNTFSEDNNHIDIPSYGYDNAGHIISKDVKTVDLPNSFKSISLKVGPLSEKVNSTTEISTPLGFSASDATDVLSVKMKNKWVRTNLDTANKTIEFEHDIHSIDTEAAVATDLNIGIDTLTIQDTTYDAAGHLTANKAHTYTLPFGYKEFTNGTGSSTVAQNTQDSLTITGDKWIRPIITQGQILFMHKNDNTEDGFSARHYTFGTQTPDFGDTFRFFNTTVDNTGHITNIGIDSVKLPKLEDQQFIYTPAVTHEATAQDVTDGLAEEVGEEVIDTPAVTITIPELIEKIKTLEALLS